MKKYIIDYELTGSLVVESTNPQAASARAGAVLRAIVKGLNEEQPNDTELSMGAAVDLEEKCRRPS